MVCKKECRVGMQVGIQATSWREGGVEGSKAGEEGSPFFFSEVPSLD